MRFSYFDAAVWSAGTTFCLMIVVTSVVQLDESRANDLVLLGGLQVLVYLVACAVFAWRREGRSFSELFALRGTHWLLLVMAVLLGVALHGPSGTVSELMERVSPMPEAVKEALESKLALKSIGQALALFLIVSAAAPFVEELLYRGALFTALRPEHGILAASGVTAVCFTLSHGEPRQWPPILMLACALAFVRAASGSMWAAVLLHGTFNGTSLGLVLLAKRVEIEIPTVYEVGLWVLSFALFGAFALVARRSERAVVARAPDEIVPPADADES